MVPTRRWPLLGGYVAAAAALVAGLWLLGRDDEWLALALVALGGVLIALVSSAARAADAEER